MARLKIERILTKGKSLLLAMDQGLEHGPKDFNLKTIDPDYVLDIARKGGYNGMILQRGVAEKYYENYKNDIPLILKVNGRASIAKLDPYAPVLCSVKRAVQLGAAAVGYTVYLGSPLEPKIFKEFSEIHEEAHQYGIPVIAWMYPRGVFVPNDTDTDLLAYAARVGLELGADFVKMKYNGDAEGFKWVVKCAGRTKLLVAGGEKKPEPELYREVKEVMNAGATGMAIGRNVWQSDKPLEITKNLKKIIFEGKKL